MSLDFERIEKVRRNTINKYNRMRGAGMKRFSEGDIIMNRGGELGLIIASLTLADAGTVYLLEAIKEGCTSFINEEDIGPSMVRIGGL